MKNTILTAFAALLLSAAVQAQTTVDSITAKYKLVPMPEPLTIEKTFPVLGVYQLSTPVDAMGTTSTSATTSTTTSATTSTTSTTGTDVATTGTVAPAANTVTVTLDSVNKGMIWVEGFPQGKFKAYLKKSPSTYRILAQKSDAGKQIPEGTLIFDPATGALNVALGKDFDDADPAAIFALNSANGATATDATAATDNTVKVKVKTPTSKSKTKVTFYTATKAQASTTTTAAPATGTFESTLQQSQNTQTQQQQQQ
jgi:hypothetical protein